MKLSLNVKMFLVFSLLLLLFILTVILLNTTILETYYRNQKEKFLIDTFNQVVDYYDQNEIDSSSDFITELQKIDSTRNIEIAVYDEENNIFVTSSNNFLRNGFFIPMGNPEKIDTDFSFPKMAESLPTDEPYSIKTIYDRKMNSDFATLYGKTYSGYLVFIRTPIESIKESVKISNRFLAMVGVLCLLVGSLVTFFISKAFTKPIMKLRDIANKMANLDFSDKYEVESNDEIGVLGSSINKLSESLEKTIKDLKETNLELEKDVEETSKISEMRNQFISDVSHELKTPIALIQGYAEGLNDGIVTDEESRKYYVEVILDEANKMSNLTKDLLDLSRLEYGKQELMIEDFNISELVSNTLKKNEVLFKEKNITCKSDFNDETMVKGDCARIEQVLTNYLSNAIKNVSGENVIKCTISTNDDKVRVSVFNSGNPISDEDMPRLWTRFYKADASRNREVGGTGIGLSLVKAIMTLHKNDYGALNKDNGVEFWFELDKA